MKTIIGIDGMTCDHCVARVSQALSSLPGASGVSVNLKKGQAEMDSGSVGNEAIQTAVADAGYTVTSISEVKSGFSLFRASGGRA